MSAIGADYNDVDRLVNMRHAVSLLKRCVMILIQPRLRFLAGKSSGMRRVPVW
jgi:hypothetical protein